MLCSASARASITLEASSDSKPYRHNSRKPGFNQELLKLDCALMMSLRPKVPHVCLLIHCACLTCRALIEPRLDTAAIKANQP